MSTTRELSAEESTEPRLLALVASLSSELRPGGDVELPISLDSDLDRELGFDSLSLAELIVRLEDEFGVQLPEELLGTAESPRDLLLALQGAPAGQSAETAKVRHVAVAASTEAPATAATLLEVLHWHVQVHPDRPHVLLYTEADTPVTITYANLYDGALAMAAGLQDKGVDQGDAVAIMLPTGCDYLTVFFAILLAGCIPVPIYPPARLSQLEDHLKRHIRILNNAEARILITVKEARNIARLMTDHVESMGSVVTPAELSSEVAPHPVKAKPEDIAFLQYTSGSTGEPKGVVLTHANLVANIRAMGEAAEVSSSDVFVSWLPLYHDMGLIGAWLGSLYYAMTLVLMSPLKFLARPSQWLWAVHRHHGTLSAAPNFAYQLCLSRLTDTDLQGLDLSSWRMAFNGAEQVSPHTIKAFNDRFEQYGLRPSAMSPVYGLAEAGVGLAFPPLKRGIRIDRVDQEALLSRGEARPAPEDRRDTLEFVACGRPLPGYQIRVAEAGHELPDRREGRVQFQGPSATSGYYRNPKGSRSLYDGDWLDTGDLGYIANGDIYLTSRAKDLIVRAGRNIYPYEVEETIGELPGVRTGCVAMFGSVDPQTRTERVVVVAETRETDEQRLGDLRQASLDIATRLLGMPPDEIILAPPHTILKTSSGKIRRSAMRELYERGELAGGSRAVWRQIMRLVLTSIVPHLRRLQHRGREGAYALWARLIFCLAAPVIWLGAVLLPTLALRWGFTRGGIRLVLRLAGISMTTNGLQRLPDNEPVVLVANHASYLDGPALIAALRDPVVVVAKAELGKRFISRLLVQRLDMHLVERLDRIQGAEDARATIEILKEGRSLVFFPEGTLIRSPGLLPFHLGAFIAAVETGTPVYPLLIKGTRSVLRGDEWYPRRAPIRIELGEPLCVDDSGWDAAVALRDATRTQMLADLREPDLAD